MQPEKRDHALPIDMLTAARHVLAFALDRTLEEYQSDVMLRSAIERQIEIIGEAARGVSASRKDAHPEIPWRIIMAQRHILAHDYGVIDDSRVWRVAVIHIPELIQMLQPLIDVLASEENAAERGA